MDKSTSSTLLARYPDGAAPYSAAAFDAQPPEFSSRRLHKDLVTQILEHEVCVPSARNMQPLDSVVVTERRLITRIANMCDALAAVRKASLLQIIGGNIHVARRVEAISSHPYTTAEKGQFLFVHVDGAAFAHAGRLVAAARGVASIWRYRLELQVRNAIKRLLGLRPSWHNTKDEIQGMAFIPFALCVGVVL